MEKELTEEQWEEFVKIVTDSVESHPEIGFLYFIAHSLGVLKTFRVRIIIINYS